MIKHGEAPFLECSSKGDTRFSAYYVKVSARDQKTIEERFQAFKVFREDHTVCVDGVMFNRGFVTGLTPAQAKERQRRGEKAINQLEAAVLYARMWEEYLGINPHLLRVLKQASGLSDRFGQPGHCCQATELWYIRNGLFIPKGTHCACTRVPR
jgi:hypothetical protein